MLLAAVALLAAGAVARQPPHNPSEFGRQQAFSTEGEFYGGKTKRTCQCSNGATYECFDGNMWDATDSKVHGVGGDWEGGCKVCAREASQHFGWTGRAWNGRTEACHYCRKGMWGIDLIFSWRSPYKAAPGTTFCNTAARPERGRSVDDGYRSWQDDGYRSINYNRNVLERLAEREMTPYYN